MFAVRRASHCAPRGGPSPDSGEVGRGCRGNPPAFPGWGRVRSERLYPCHEPRGDPPAGGREDPSRSG
eukprot:10711276-Lingulodinium_polyedra.AAC.1